ncbi:hypothetical protein GCM10027059_26910 [Myceligenerans halotolerans]
MSWLPEHDRPIPYIPADALPQREAGAALPPVERALLIVNREARRAEAEQKETS